VSNPFNRDFITDYDMNDPELSERWDEVVSHMHRSQCPVARSNVGEGYYILNRYEDVKRAASDWETFSASDGFMVNRPAGMPFMKPGESDPPIHTELRALLHPFLRPVEVAKLESIARAQADALIDTFIEKGAVDVVESYANPLPQSVFSVNVAGMDPTDMPFLMKVFNLAGPPEERGDNFALGIAKVAEYLKRRSEEAPRSDIASALLGFQHPGYEFEDKVLTLVQLIIGGIGTTGYAISGGLHHLATHPDDRRLLLDEPKALPRAIDEFLRMFGGAPNMGRRTKKEVEIDGNIIPANSRVVLSFGAAGRDPSVCERPDVLDITRKSNRHLAFGAGNHACIGAPLARVELKVAYEQFLARIPEFELEPGFQPLYETANTRHMVALRLRFPPGKRVA
jgi:cytochrome P450